MSIVCVFADAKAISSKQSLLVSQWPVKVTLHLVQNLYHMEHPQMECWVTSAVTESSVTFNHKTRVGKWGSFTLFLWSCYFKWFNWFDRFPSYCLVDEFVGF